MEDCVGSPFTAWGGVALLRPPAPHNQQQGEKQWSQTAEPVWEALLWTSLKFLHP